MQLRKFLLSKTHGVFQCIYVSYDCRFDACLPHAPLINTMIRYWSIVKCKYPVEDNRRMPLEFLRAHFLRNWQYVINSGKLKVQEIHQCLLLDY